MAAAKRLIVLKHPPSGWCFRPAEQTGEHVGTLVVGAGQSGDESNEPSQFVGPFGGFSAP